jgi:hypothetical protein
MQISRPSWPAPFKPSGFRIVYRSGVTNYCPACGQSQWHVGRQSAQCAFCATAVPLASFPEARAA